MTASLYFLLDNDNIKMTFLVLQCNGVPFSFHGNHRISSRFGKAKNSNFYIVVKINFSKKILSDKVMGYVMNGTHIATEPSLIKTFKT